MGIIITTTARQRKMLKEAYEKGLNIGCDIGYQERGLDEWNRGTIIPGYDLEQDLEEILKRKGCSDENIKT